MWSARRIVGWYCGLPQDSDLQPPLHAAQHVVVVGQGNVAIDVARILLTPVDRLKVGVGFSTLCDGMCVAGIIMLLTAHPCISWKDASIFYLFCE